MHVGRHFEAGPALDQIEAERCTLAFPAFETIWLAVQNEPRFPEADLSSLRLVVAVGSPGSLRLMQERLPSVTQVSSFGSTECGGFVSMGRPGDPLEVRLTTNGRAFPGSELRIVDPETGEDLPPNTPGEILMRGPTRFVRYHEEPELTAAVIDEDGWFHSGDLGRMDEEGRLSFAGRLKDMLKVGGENVAAAEIETYLLGHPACEIVQVVAAPDARYTEVAAAFVQLGPGRDGDRAGADRLLPRADRDVQGAALRPLRRGVADVRHEDPEVQAPRADRRRARAGGHHRGAEAQLEVIRRRRG